MVVFFFFFCMSRVAFIEFRTPLAARKAFEKFSNAKIDGRSINLEYADQDKFKGMLKVFETLMSDLLVVL